jgi:hypothetical protein
MKYLHTLDFLFVDEMNQAIEIIETREFIGKAMKIVEKRYFKSPNSDIDSGSLVLEMTDPSWLYNLGYSLGLKYKTPF